MTRAERANLTGLAGVTASLDQPASADSTTVLGELVAPENDDWVDDVEQEMMADQLRGALDRLEDLPKQVLTMRFGLDGSTPLSLQATADRLGIGVRRVRRAEEEALAELRDDSDVIAVHEPA
jgi:DNA-directed RNA polymerase sigma subunit (sigma70/sigma32)